MTEYKYSIIHSFSYILRNIGSIRNYLNSQKFKPLNDLIDVDIDSLNKAFDVVINRMQNNKSERIDLSGSRISLRRLNDSWADLASKISLGVTDEIKVKYENIIKLTIQYAEFLIGLLEKKSVDKIRIKDPDDEHDKFEMLKKRRQELRQKYESALNETPPDEEKIKLLKEKLEESGVAVVESKAIMENIKTDSAEEIRLRNRIDKAFDELSKDKHLDEEIKRLKAEYYITLWSIPIVIIIFVVFYIVFLLHLKDLSLICWYEYLPYTMSVPITVALLWLFVYLKNRANKISIELGSQIYNIHYLEGLLKLTNCVSRSSGEALDNIERIVNTMIDSFLEKMKQQNFEEKNLEKIEKQEIERSPYWKILKEIKDLITDIRK